MIELVFVACLAAGGGCGEHSLLRLPETGLGWSKTMLRYLAPTGLLAAATYAHAGELVPYQAESIALGSIRGVTYFTRGEDGFRVVTTLADGEGGLPVRFEMTLADSQKIIISVPGKLGEPGEVLAISRAGDKIILTRPPAAGSDLEPGVSSGSAN